MRRDLVLVGFFLFVVSIAIGFYASQRNCLIAFLAQGHMSFWSGIKLLAGLTALAGLIIALLSFVRRT